MRQNIHCVYAIGTVILNSKASSLKENEGGSPYEKKNLVQRGQNGFGST